MEVLVVGEESRSEIVAEDKFMKVWVGPVAQSLLEHILWDEEPGSGDCLFSWDGVSGYVPYGQSLADAASEHFAFLSAESTADKKGDASGSQELPSRVVKLEDTLAQMHVTLQEVPQHQKGKTAAKPKAQASKPAGDPLAELRAEFPMLDAGVVKAALDGGIERETPTLMQKLVVAGSRRRNWPILLLGL